MQTPSASEQCQSPHSVFRLPAARRQCHQTPALHHLCSANLPWMETGQPDRGLTGGTWGLRADALKRVLHEVSVEAEVLNQSWVTAWEQVLTTECNGGKQYYRTKSSRAATAGEMLAFACPTRAAVDPQHEGKLQATQAGVACLRELVTEKEHYMGLHDDYIKNLKAKTGERDCLSWLYTTHKICWPSRASKVICNRPKANMWLPRKFGIPIQIFIYTECNITQCVYLKTLLYRFIITYI